MKYLWNFWHIFLRTLAWCGNFEKESDYFDRQKSNNKDKGIDNVNGKSTYEI